MVEAQKGKNSPQVKFDSFTYIIPGPPVSWCRVAPNYAQRKMYDTQKNIKLLIGIELSKQHDMRDVFYGPLHIDWYFYMELPPTLKKKREQWIGKPHECKPDASNLIKFYEDVCNKIIFKDDCLISTGTWEKVYDDNPRTEFTIRQL